MTTTDQFWQYAAEAMLDAGTPEATQRAAPYSTFRACGHKLRCVAKAR